MNQRFEDTYDRATKAICGMAKDYRLLEEKNRLLRARICLVDDQADILRGQCSDMLDKLHLAQDKLSTAQVKLEEIQHTNGALAMELVRATEHPEYHEAKFSLSSQDAPEEGEWDFDERTIEHEESDIDLAIGMDGQRFAGAASPSGYVGPGHYNSWVEGHAMRLNVTELLNAYERTVERMESDIDLASPAMKSFHTCVLPSQRQNLYSNFFDVIM